MGATYARSEWKGGQQHGVEARKPCWGAGAEVEVEGWKWWGEEGDTGEVAVGVAGLGVRAGPRRPRQPSKV